MVVAGGCEESASPPRRHASSPPPARALEVRENSGLLFTFFTNRAEMRTVEAASAVDRAARAAVMVTDPRRSALPGGVVYVADLSKKRDNGTFRSWTEPKGSWLARARPHLSRLRRRAAAGAGTGTSARPAAKAPAKRPAKRGHKRRKKRRRPRKKARAGKREPPRRDSGPARARPRRVRVVLFGTAWCPSCRTARAFFKARKVAFQDLDVERDPLAARQYAAIQRARGLRPGVVPLIVIGKRVFQGFSKLQIGSALAAAQRVAR